MPLFFFHLRGPDGLERDVSGIEYASLEEAYVEACRAIPGVAAELIMKRIDPMKRVFEIADAEDTPLIEVPFNETFRETRLPRPMPGDVRSLTQVERVNDLVSSVQRNVELLRTQMDESRRWVREVRESNKGVLDRK